MEKDVKIVLELMKERLEGRKEIGLCNLSDSLMIQGLITVEQRLLFRVYYRGYANNKKQFYDGYEDKTKDKTKFAWMPWDNEARIKWINKQLKNL